MKKLLFGLLAAIILTIGSVYQTKAQSVSGSVGTVKRGGSVRGSVVLSLPGDLHANSNRPSDENLIPTKVSVTAPGAKIGAVTYPRGKNRRFAFSENALNVYEGSTTFGFNLTVPANFKGNVVKVRAVVRYQACTNEVCYPPKSKEITLTAKVQ